MWLIAVPDWVYLVGLLALAVLTFLVPLFVFLATDGQRRARGTVTSSGRGVARPLP
jgi:hypothetical protein